jgi:hypothetical protein
MSSQHQRVRESSTPGSSRDPSSRLLGAVAILGVILLLATLAWFRGWFDETDGPRGSDVTSPDGARRPHADKDASGLGRRDVDAANHARGSRSYGAHEVLAATVSADASPFGALEGRIVDWDTRIGISGAELAFVSTGVTHETVSGADGRYRFEAPSLGDWSLAMVTADGYLPYAPELGRSSVSWTSSAAQKIDHADLFLHPGITYQGQVVDAEGKALAGAVVELFGAESGERALVGIASSFETDDAGAFEFQAPDWAVLEAQHPDHPPGRAQLDEAAQVGRRLTITMGNAPAASDQVITGLVFGADGVALAGVEVQALFAGRGGAIGRSASAMTDQTGAFVLAPLDAARYVIRAMPNAGGAFVQRGPVEPGAFVELRLEAGLSLEGRLVDDAGEAVAAGTVELSRVVDPLRRARIASVSVFDAEGRFRFEGLQAGRYELRGSAQGRASSDPVAVELPAAGNGIQVVLGQGGAVHGRVVDARTHDPIARAQVVVSGLASESVLPSLSSTVTEIDGGFELVGITPGRISIEVTAFDHDGRVVSGVEIEAGERRGPIEVELNPVADGQRAKTEITGIGVQIAPVRDALTIADVVPGGGAQAAGIKRGDAIVAVEGVTVVELGFENAIQNIRGEVGTRVDIELRRRGQGEKTERMSVERRLVSAG